jgi:hypothetical protein
VVLPAPAPATGGSFAGATLTLRVTVGLASLEESVAWKVIVRVSAEGVSELFE